MAIINKEAIYLLMGVLIIISGCSKSKTNQSKVDEYNFDKQESSQQKDYSDELVEVDVTKTYPKIDIHLEDIADVEFVSLETNNDYLCNGNPVAFTDSFILYANKKEGSVFVFDKSGKAMQRFNHKGQSGKEYVAISQALWDDKNKELYINDMFTKRILVYDLDGNYKRSFYHAKGQFENIVNYSDSSLICRDVDGSFGLFPDEAPKNPFTIISKQTGKIIKDIVIPFKEKLTIAIDGNTPSVDQLFNFGDKSIMTEQSSDTIYSISENCKLSPMIVRTPTVRTMTVPVFLFVRFVTSRYIFMQSFKKEFDEKTGKGFSGALLVYDRKDKRTYEYALSYQGTKLSFASFPKIRSLCFTTNKDVHIGEMNTYLLKKQEHDNDLTGSLKELAAKVTEDDNPVLMKITFKR